MPPLIKQRDLSQLECVGDLAKLENHLRTRDTSLSSNCLFLYVADKTYCSYDCQKFRYDRPRLFKEAIGTLGKDGSTIDGERFVKVMRTLFCRTHDLVATSEGQNYMNHFGNLWDKASNERKKSMWDFLQTSDRNIDSPSTPQRPSLSSAAFVNSAPGAVPKVKLEDESSTGLEADTPTRPRTAQPKLGRSIIYAVHSPPKIPDTPVIRHDNSNGTRNGLASSPLSRPPNRMDTPPVTKPDPEFGSSEEIIEVHRKKSIQDRLVSGQNPFSECNTESRKKNLGAPTASSSTGDHREIPSNELRDPGRESALPFRIGGSTAPREEYRQLSTLRTQGPAYDFPFTPKPKSRGKSPVRHKDSATLSPNPAERSSPSPSQSPTPVPGSDQRRRIIRAVKPSAKLRPVGCSLNDTNVTSINSSESSKSARGAQKASESPQTLPADKEKALSDKTELGATPFLSEVQSGIAVTSKGSDQNDSLSPSALHKSSSHSPGISPGHCKETATNSPGSGQPRVSFDMPPAPYPFSSRSLERSPGRCQETATNLPDRDQSLASLRNTFATPHPFSAESPDKSPGHREEMATNSPDEDQSRVSPKDTPPTRGRRPVLPKPQASKPHVFVPRQSIETAECIRSLLLKPIHPDTGCIYILEAPSFFANFPPSAAEQKPWIKIGITRNVFERVRNIKARCGIYDLKTVVRFGGGTRIEMLRRVERLCHEELNNFRRTLDCKKAGVKSAKCDTKHSEWFAVDIETARSTVERWIQFLGHKPYGNHGPLLNEFWCERLTEENFWMHINERPDQGKTDGGLEAWFEKSVEAMGK